MPIYAMTYDLNNQKNYPKITAELERLKCHRAALSFWLGNFNNTTDEILNHFKGFIDTDDTLIVAKTSIADIKTYKARAGTSDWIKANS